jgi:hypothetical protein
VGTQSSTALGRAPLLLADPSPALRWLVLREMFGRPDDDPEVRELAELREADPLVTDLLALQAADGSWTSAPANELQATSQALMRLGYLGFGPDHRAVQRGAEYLFSQQQEDGAWPLAGTWRVPDSIRSAEEREGYSMVPLQTAIPLRSLAMCGYAGDPRIERAYDWLLAQRLDDGAWPTGIAAGNYGYVGGYRRLAHSRWGCRSNTTGALICLAHHPEHRRGPEARRALDLLLGRETQEKHALGFEVARLIGAEPARGFLTYFARFDVALVLDLCWRVGATPEDERVAEAMTFVQEQRGPYGLWEYAPRPQASRWVTFDILRSLSRLEANEGEWLGFEPRTPFQAYPRRPRRY